MASLAVLVKLKVSLSQLRKSDKGLENDPEIDIDTKPLKEGSLSPKTQRGTEDEAVIAQDGTSLLVN